LHSAPDPQRISRRFISMEEAGERMELSREWVNFLVSTGRLLRSAAGVSDPQTTLIDVKSIDTLLMNFDGVAVSLAGIERDRNPAVQRDG
jgi:hypothetical protein